MKEIRNEIINQNKKAVVYCRVSTSDQADKGQSIEAQESMCLRKAEEDGYSEIEVIKDEGKSGGSLKRPGIEKIMKMVGANEISAIYIVNTDRLARNTTDHLSLRALFRKNNVLLKCINQPIVDDSAVSRTMDTIMASFNEMQRLVTAEKVMATMEEKAKAGYYPTYAPLGYKNITREDPSIERAGQKIIIKKEDVAPLVKQAFELYATGNYNAYEVNDIMYERGLRARTGKRLSQNRIYDILKNRFYLGEVNWGSVHLKKGKHEPLIDEYLFDRVQEIMRVKNNHVSRRRKYKWLLSGFLRCYKHGCKYTAEWHLNKKLAYYHCTKGGCGKFIEQNKLEEMVADKFKSLEFSKEFIDKVIEKAKNIFYERRTIYDKKRSSFVNQRTAFEAKRKVAEDRLLDKTIDSDSFSRMNREITKELDIIDNRLAELEKQRNVNVDVAKEIINLTSNIYQTYKNASINLKRQYLGFFWDNFEVCDGLIIKSVSGLLFDQLLKLEQAFQKSENTLIPTVSNSIINYETLSPTQEIIINIFSDKSYMEGLYNKLLYIKAMQKDEIIT